MEISFNRLSPLYKFLQEVRQEKIPTTVAFKFYKLFKAAEENITFFQEEYTKLLKEFAQIDEDGQFKYTDDGAILIQEGRVQECANQIDKLNKEMAQMPDIKFTELELETIPGITIEILEILEPFMA